MKKTTNYQLNQWEKTDRILMDDFNADNAIIDAALAGKAPMALLHDETLTAETREIELDMGGENWGSYGIIFLVYSPGAKNDGGSVRVGPTKDGSLCAHAVLGQDVGDTHANLSIVNHNEAFTCLFFPGKNPKSLILCLGLHYGSCDYGYTAWFDYTGTLYMTVSGSPFTAGANIKVYGIM